MKMMGVYEAELVDDTTGAMVQSFQSKNVINYGFIGGLFKYMFGIGNTNNNASIDVCKTPVQDKAHFARIYLCTQTATPTASDSDDLANVLYNNSGSGIKVSDYKDMTSNIITSSAVTLDTSARNIKLTLQVTFNTTEASGDTWYSMILANWSAGGSYKVISRVLMGQGINKTSGQTLRVSYNFTIQA